MVFLWFSYGSVDLSHGCHGSMAEISQPGASPSHRQSAPGDSGDATAERWRGAVRPGMTGTLGWGESWVISMVDLWWI